MGIQERIDLVGNVSRVWAQSKKPKARIPVVHLRLTEKCGLCGQWYPQSELVQHLTTVCRSKGR